MLLCARDFILNLIKTSMLAAEKSDLLSQYESDLAEARKKVLEGIAEVFKKHGFDPKVPKRSGDSTERILIYPGSCVKLSKEEPTDWNNNCREVSITPKSFGESSNGPVRSISRSLYLRFSFYCFKDVSNGVPRYESNTFPGIVTLEEFNKEETLKLIIDFLSSDQVALFPEKLKN